MAVEYGPRGVRDRVVHIVAFHQDRVKPGNGPTGEVPSALEDLRQQLETRRRVSFLAPRLSARQANLPLGHRKPRDRIYDEQYIRSLIAEILGDRRCQKCRADPQGGRPVRGCHDDDRLRQPLRAECLFDEAPYLPVSLSNQADHIHLGGAISRQRSQQCALPDPRSAEETDALPLAARQKTVDDPNPRGQWLRDRFAVHRTGRRLVEMTKLGTAKRAGPVDWGAEGVHHSAQKARANRGPSLGIACNNRISELQLAALIQRDRQHSLAPKTDNLRAGSSAICRLDLAQVPYRRQWAFRLNQGTHNLCDHSLSTNGIEAPDLGCFGAKKLLDAAT